MLTLSHIVTYPWANPFGINMVLLLLQLRKFIVYFPKDGEPSRTSVTTSRIFPDITLINIFCA